MTSAYTSSGEHYHLVGVAGVGMSALAQVLLGQGMRVSGSDRHFDRGEDLEVIAKLRGAGVRFLPQDGRGVTAGTAGVVVSTAIEKGNPDLEAAECRAVPVMHRAEMLARAAAGKRCVAVTGTSGKSTVTGMIGWILDQAGADPVVVNGAPVLNWVTPAAVGNVRLGKSDLWVLEADESDRSLLRYHPDWAVVTNISKDHFDCDTAAALFRAFARQVRKGTVNPAEQPELLQDFRPEVTPAGTRFRHQGVAVEVPLAGLHNAENALLAVALCERLGISPAASAAALTSFRGIQRRLERVGEAGGVTVIDDYAHNPVKIRAAWRAAALAAGRVVAIWRPHGYGPLALMMDELIEACSEACRPEDRLLILPVYDAGGTADRRVRSETLAAGLRRKGTPAACVREDEVAARVIEHARPGDTVLVMGARDPGLPKLARRILSEVAARAYGSAAGP